MDDVPEIQGIIERLTEAWNANDARAWVRDFAEDCLLINMLGDPLDGIQANEARHAAVFNGIFKGSRIAMTVDRIRFIAGGQVAVTDTTLTLTGHQRLPPGVQETQTGVHRMRMRHVLETRSRNGALEWVIVFSQNQSVPPQPAETVLARSLEAELYV